MKGKSAPKQVPVKQMRVNVFLIATAKMVLSALEIIVTPLSWILLLNFQVNNFYRLGRAIVRSENPEVL